MPVSRRHLAIAGTSLLAASALGAGAALAATTSGDADAAAAAAVEAFRQAMLGNNRKQFEALCVEQMTYGHSSGRVQTKAEFIADATSGKTIWKSITQSDQTVHVVGSNALVRFIFTGEALADGKTNTLHFGVMMVWLKQRGKWRLLARQGYKI